MSTTTLFADVRRPRARSTSVHRSRRLSLRRPERTIFVGTSAIVRRLMSEMAARPNLNYEIIGIVDDPPTATEALSSPYPRLGSLHQLAGILEATHPDRVIVGVTDRRGRLPVDELLEARVNGTAVEDALTAYERLTGKLAIEALTPGTLVAGDGFHASRTLRAAQRALGIVVAAAGLMLFAPLLALIALAIKTEESGPVLFRQTRLGPDGRPFDLLKFRTMYPAAQPTSEWAGDNVSRITPIGRWLRKMRLDELPQLINVLRGDMNLVGPRPHPVCNVELFLRHIPYYALRASVRPGLTGWAQVRYRYANNLEEETEKMRYDLYYIKHRSICLDLRILFATAAIVLSGCRSLTPAVDRAAPASVPSVRLENSPRDVSSSAVLGATGRRLSSRALPSADTGRLRNSPFRV